MKLRLQGGLPYITATLEFRGRRVELENVLIDTGSASSIFSADKVSALNIRYEPDDVVHRIRGVGGAEFVFTKRVDVLALDKLQLRNFEIEVGALEYGFEIDGIIVTDFLTQVHAVIDLSRIEIYPSSLEEE